MNENFGDPSGNTNENYGHQGGAQAHWDDPWATMGEDGDTMMEEGPPDEFDEACCGEGPPDEHDEPSGANLEEATAPPEQAAETKETRKPTLQQRREADTQHDLRQCSSHSVCRKCCQHAHTTQLSGWLRDAPRCKKLPEEILEKIWGDSSRPQLFPTPPRVQLGSGILHSSHMAVVFRGLWWCSACGCHGSLLRAQGLITQCKKGPTAQGVSALVRLRKGLPPKGSTWPSDAWTEVSRATVL